MFEEEREPEQDAEVGTALTRQLETTPPGPELAAVLAAHDPTEVRAVERVALLQASARQESWTYANRVAILAAMAALDSDGGPCGDDDWAREDVAVALRISPVAAINQLHTARDLAVRLPRTFDALASGELGALHARVVADTTMGLETGHARAVEEQVLPRGLSQTPGALRAAVQRAIAAVDPHDHAERAEENRRLKSASRHVFGDGTAELRLGLPAEDLNVLWGYMTAKAEEPRAPGDDRDKGTRRVDALLDLVRAALAGSPLPTVKPTEPLVQVVIDLPDLLALRNNPATLIGSGPLPAEVVRAWAADSAWQRLVRDPVTGHLLDLGTVIYRPSAELRRYLDARDRTCRFPGCTRRARACDSDHAVPHDHGGPTASRNLACLCRRHHRMKTHTNWTYQIHPDASITWTDPHGNRHHEPPPDAHPDT
jgi:hypothetical protein